MIIVGVLIGYAEKYASKKNRDNDIKVADFLQSLGIKQVLLSYHKYDEETGIFSEYVDMWTGETIVGDFKPDVIRKRVTLGTHYTFKMIAKYYPCFPSQDIFAVSSNKYDTYLLLQEYQPHTATLSGFFNNTQQQDKFSDQLVVKPRKGTGGFGIRFMSKSDLIEDQERYRGMNSFYIVQDFKDFSSGYPGLTSGNHDMRICYIGGKVSFAYLREPSEGELLSNIHKGGKGYGIDIENIPEALLKTSDAIAAKIDDEKGIYSLDFGYVASEDRWYLIEINCIPGLLSPEVELEAWQKQYLIDLSTLIKSF